MMCKQMRCIVGLKAALACAVVTAVGCAADPGESRETREGNLALEGELEVFAIDHEDGLGATEYLLRTASGELVSLSFVEEPSLASGDRVRITGQRAGNHVVVDEYTMLQESVSSQSHALTGNTLRTQTKLAVLMVHWGAPDTQTPATLRAKLFTNTNSTAAYYTENSYSLFGMQGDIFGWYQVPAMQNCDYRTLATNARDAAQRAGVDLSSYRQILYYFPRNSQCSWSGLAMVGSPNSPARDSWYNGSSGCVVLAHELLHNFGARHARSYSCTTNGNRVAIASPAQCTYSEYGDPYDVMGGGCYHTSAFQKSAQAWFGKCNAVTATATGEFDIVPTAVASNDIQLLRVPMNSSLCPSGTTSCFYYIEYRQPVGLFDSASTTAQVHQGVLIRVAPQVDFTGRSRPGDPYLLDMTPASANGHRDPALTVGQTFTDPSGVQFSLVSRTAASARVRLTFPGDGSGAPTCLDGTQFGSSTPPTSSPPPSACPTGQTAHGGHCYLRTATARTYDAALAECRALGAGYGLAHIQSATENQFVAGLIAGTESWLGATDRVTEGDFFWEGTSTRFWTGGLQGTPVGGAYTNFTADEPNDAGGNSDCLRMVANGGWRDVACSATYRAVCESAL